ncbi:MAG: hypothetical protein ABIP29_02430, partial [Candidatus Eisenbacteria bacterium]
MHRSPTHLSSRVGCLLLAAVGLTAALSAAPTPTLAAIGDRSPDRVWSEAATNAVAPGTLAEAFDTPGAYRLYQLD